MMEPLSLPPISTPHDPQIRGGVSGAPSTEAALVGQALLALRWLVAACARAGAGPCSSVDLAELGEALGRDLLALLVLLFAEDRGLLAPTDGGADGLPSARRLYAELDASRVHRPASLARRATVWPRVRAARDVVYGAAGGADEARSKPGGGPFEREGAAAGIDDETAHAVLGALLFVEGRSVDYRAVGLEHLGRVFETLLGFEIGRGSEEPRALVLRPSRARRSTGSHYTPPELARSIVERALEPVLAALGSRPSADQLLSLRICDPAMGSGAFLLAACRLLADGLVRTWHHQGRLARLERCWGDPVAHALRLVATGCLYGVDRDPRATELARRSLWLLVGSPRVPLDAFEHNLRSGDSLVGLSASQLAAFDWRDPARATELPGMTAALGEALGVRRRLMAMHRSPSGEAADVEQHAARCRELRGRAERLVQAARLCGDLALGAFFAEPNHRLRRAERARRWLAVRSWLEAGRPLPASLGALRAELREHVPAFHWPLEFPELFAASRPADATRLGLDVVVGNPPFLGGKRISTEHGASYAAWLHELHGASKNTDLAAHFLRRAAMLVADEGTIGLIATDTLAQGATRRDGLQRLLSEGWTLYDAVRTRPWPGDATVNIAIVHLARGALGRLVGLGRRLDGRSVPFVNSSLRAMPEHRDPACLRGSRGLCFIGCFLRARGFVVTAAERQALLDARAAHAECVLPFLGGEEINTSARHDYHRYVIAFFDEPLAEVERRWPEALELVRRRVKPVRERLAESGIDGLHRRRWWQFANTRPELRAALAPLGRCWVAPRVSKHLCIARQPVGRVFSDQLCVFALDDYASFAVLQSRLHEIWARLQSSTFGHGLRYTPSTCLETFPFPDSRWLGRAGGLTDIGRQLYLRRARFQREVGLGLTATYNALLDSRCRARRLVELRTLHHELDLAVLAAYGWDDVRLPPRGAAAPGPGSAPWTRVEAEIVERLFELNTVRAAAGR